MLGRQQIILAAVFAMTTVWCSGSFAQIQEPTKAALIKTLETVFDHCSKEDYPAAAKYFVVPEGFKAEMLAPMIERREISWGGIKRLEADAKFGKASEFFEAERLVALAKRSGVAPEKLFGFNHKAGDVAGEVLALWDGKVFKLARVDDVGKLTSPEKTTNAATETKAAPESASERIARIAPTLGPLKAAADAKPEDSGLRAQYAQALFMVGNLPLSWTEMMKARNLDPESKGLMGGMDALINAFTKKGIFTVGVPIETIESLLGEPTEKHETKARIRYVYGHWGIDFSNKGRLHQIIDLRGVNTTHFVPAALLDVDLNGHLCMFRRVNRSTVSNFYFEPGQTIASYTSQLVVERNPSVGKMSIDDVGKKVMADEGKAYPGIKHKILAKGDKTIIVASMIPMADKTKNHHRLTRLILGERDLHRITYTKIQEAEPSMEIQMKWLGIFKAAKLMTMEDIKKARAAKQAERAAAEAAK